MFEAHLLFRKRRKKRQFYAYFWALFGEGCRHPFFIDLGSILVLFWEVFGCQNRKKQVPERHEKTAPKKVTQAGEKVVRLSASSIQRGGGHPTKILRTGIGDPCKHPMTTPRRASGHGGGL